MVHVQSLTGSHTAASEIVHHCLRRYSRSAVLGDERTHDSLLKELTDMARETATEPVAATDDGTASDIHELPFMARACISLRINFELGFDRISHVTGLPEEEVKRLYDEALGSIGRPRP